MNLYLISRTDAIDYDEYDSAVVAAPDEATARDMHPRDGAPVDWATGSRYAFDTWCRSQDCVTVKLIGTASVEQGVILASYNAG